MNAQTDSELLRSYAERRVEPAFAELVRRHVDFVYSTAARMVRDPHLAEDVTQGVFVALVKSAPHLLDRATLTGWLHQTARNIAAQTVRTIERRRTREQEAASMNQLFSSQAEASWEQLAPHLDAALGELSESDREAVLLRYFRNHDFRTVGATLGISDDAAQKRVSRAVEQMREFFAKHGVTVGASAIGVLISANALQAAPAGLAATISAAAVLTGTAVSTPTVITTTKTIAMTTLQKALITAAFVAAAGVGIFEARQAAQLREQNRTLQRQQMSLAEQIQQLQRERDNARDVLTGLSDEIKRLESGQNISELLKLRGLVGMLRNQLVSATNISSNASAQQQSAPPHPAWRLREPRRIGEFQNVGNETPEATAETVLWAAYNNDTNLVKMVHLPTNVVDGVQQLGTLDILTRSLATEILAGASLVKGQSNQVWLEDGSTTDLVSGTVDGVPGTNEYAGVVLFHLTGGNMDDPNASKWTPMYYAKIDGVWKLVIPKASPHIPKK